MHANKGFSLRQFENAYNDLVETVLPVISNKTGCPAPCSYKEYRFIEAPIEVSVRHNVHEVLLLL